MSSDMPLAVHQLTKAEAAEWDQLEAQQRPGLDRVTCQQCRNRSQFMCVALKVSCVPPGIPHRCDRFSKRVEFKRAA